MLLDHFHPPLDRYGWKSLHHQWASVLTADLNQRLPRGWRAQSDVEFGIEVDVGVVDDEGGDDESFDSNLWSNPPVSLPLPRMLDTVEVQILNPGYGPSLVAAIELVSPANKDRPDHREAFLNKCLSLLGQGAGVLVVDVVTERRANLHQLLVERLGGAIVVGNSPLHATSYRPRDISADESVVDIWHSPLEIGVELPESPLFLRVGPVISVDLAATYKIACDQLRLPVTDVSISN